MAFPVNPFACSIDPDSAECRESKRFFRELFEAMYIARFLPKLPIPRPIPDPPPFFGDPSPQPSLEAFHNVVSAELLAHALQDPTPTPILKALKESNLQYDVAKNLLQQFEHAAKSLKQELKQLG